LRIDGRQSGEFAAAVRRAKSSGKLTALPDIQLKTDLVVFMRSSVVKIWIHHLWLEAPGWGIELNDKQQRLRQNRRKTEAQA